MKRLVSGEIKDGLVTGELIYRPPFSWPIGSEGYAVRIADGYPRKIENIEPLIEIVLVIRETPDAAL
jgi:hypothetical protein